MTYYLHNNNTIRETAECMGEGAYCHPQLVAVIPVEDRRQAQRLMGRVLRELGMSMSTIAATSAMQAALREFADPKPPKPAEPTGWLAAVEDADGNRWCLHGGPVEPGLEWYSPDLNCRRRYADIDAVRVLSEGVQP